MALTLVYGRAGSGKSEYVKRQALAAQKAGKKVFVVVPEQYTHATERAYLDDVCGISPLGLEVLSFERLSRRVMEEVGGLTKKHINNVGKAVLLSGVLKHVPLSYYQRMRTQKGFIDVLMEAISEFKKYQVEPAALISQAEKTDNPALGQKLADLATVYENYEQRLQDSAADMDDVLDALAQNLPKTRQFEGSIVFFDAFSSFIPQEQQVILALLRLCSEVVVTLCTDTVRADEKSVYSLFAPTVITANKLKMLCEKHGIAMHPPVYLEGNYKHPKNGMLQCMEQSLYRMPPRTFDINTGEIQLFYDLNPYTEVENTASAIVSLVRDEGYRYREIGVVCGDLPAYAKIVAPVFQKYEIPCFIDEKQDALCHPLILFVLGALDIYTEAYSYESVFSFLRLGCLPLSDDEVDALDTYALAVRLTKRGWTDPEKWHYTLKKYAKHKQQSEEFLQTVTLARDKFLKELLCFHQAIRGRHPAKELARALYNYLTAVGLPNWLEARLADWERQGARAQAQQDAEVWKTIVDALDEICLHEGEEMISPSQFRQDLYAALSQYKIGLVPTSLDQVAVGNVERSKHGDIRALFVLGVCDGTFPVPRTPSGVFSDRERELLKQEGLELSETAKTKTFYNRFLVYSCLCTPTNRLFLSFPVSDSAQKSMRPAFVVTALKTMFPTLKVNSRLDASKNNPLSQVTCKLPTAEWLAQNIVRHPEEGLIKDVYSYYLQHFKDVAVSIRRCVLFSPQAHKLDERQLSLFFKHTIYTTVSRLQEYRGCKYSYFLKYMLELSEREVFQVGFSDVGSFVHRVFESLCTAMEQDGLTFQTVDDIYIASHIDAMILEYIDQLKAISSEFNSRQAYLVRRLKRMLTLCFGVLKTHIAASKFEPLGYEMRFGENGVGTISIPTGQGKCVTVTGIIDRADAYVTENGTYVRVIDYKTGSKTFKLDDIFYGLDVQLMVYLDALVETNPDYRHGGALYFKIEDYFYKADTRIDAAQVEKAMHSALKMKGLLPLDSAVLDAYDADTRTRAKTATLEQFGALSKHLRSLLGALCTELLDGNIQISPYQKNGFSPCTYCPYGGVCKFDAADSHFSYTELPGISDQEIWERLEAQSDVDK